MKHLIASFKVVLIILLAGLTTLSSCKRKQRREKAKQHQLVSTPSTTAMNNIRHADKISFFKLEPADTDSVSFVNVSGVYHQPADSSAVMPDVKEKRIDKEHYILIGKYRKALLEGTGLSDADSIFIYNFAEDKLIALSLGSLNVAAELNTYASSDSPHETSDYEFGFEIDYRRLIQFKDKNFRNTYVYIGVSNPFSKGQMRPIVWKKIGFNDIPKVKINYEEQTLLKALKVAGSYDFELEGFHYYLQEYSISKPSDYSPPFRLLVLNPKNEVVYNELYIEGEGVGHAPLSFVNANNNSFSQWTGYLVKNKPPILLGFVDSDYSCETLDFIDKSNGFFDVKCDNRY